MRVKTTVAAAAIASAKASARRKARLLRTSNVHMQFEAGGADVDDQPQLAAGVDLAPEIADVDVDDVGLRQELVVPDVLEQHRPRDDLVGPAHEVFEQLELARQQIDAPLATPERALDEIHLERAGAQAG